MRRRKSKARTKKYNCKICKRPISHRGNCYACNIANKKKDATSSEFFHEKVKELESSKTYTDDFGYMRYSHNGELVHRVIAYKFIYSKNSDKYPGKFSEYIVHHKDHDKRNNHYSNLAVISKKEHQKKHSDILWNMKKEEAQKSRFDTELIILLGKTIFLILKWALRIYFVPFGIFLALGTYYTAIARPIGQPMLITTILSGVAVILIYGLLKLTAKTFIFSRDQMEEFKTDFELRK